MTRALLLATALAGCSLEQASSPPPTFTWKRPDEGAVALRAQDRTVWRACFGRTDPKPHLHPVRTLGGTELTALSPPDHPWHRGLWFSFKEIDGVNYWEEKDGASDGWTRVDASDVRLSKDGSARLRFELSYGPRGGGAVLRERRLIDMSAPDAEGGYRADWSLSFKAVDRPVSLSASGGYGGLSYRAAPTMVGFDVLDSEGRRHQEVHGQPARWADFSGFSAPVGEAAGVAIFDHPSNPGHPTRWYVVQRNGFGYLNPAFLSGQRRVVDAAPLELRYRVWVHVGRADRIRLEAEFASFAWEGEGR